MPNFRKPGDDAYFPVSDEREVDFLTLSDTNYNMDMLGIYKLHEKGLTGVGQRIGIVDSGHKAPASILHYKNFTNEVEADLNGHGTHVYSIIKTIAPDADIWVAKAMNVNGGGKKADLMEATKWLIESGCRWVNFSFAFNTNDIDDFVNVIEQGVFSGVVFCCASGNEGSDKVSFPSSYHNVFSVGAVDRSGTVTDFSNRGIEIDVVAPGKDIAGEGLNGRRAIMSGTSQATPHLTGMLALYGHREMMFNGKRPDFYSTYSYITKNSVKDLGGPGFDNSYGYGLIQPYFAGIDIPPPIKKIGWFKALIQYVFGSKSKSNNA